MRGLSTAGEVMIFSPDRYVYTGAICHIRIKTFLSSHHLCFQLLLSCNKQAQWHNFSTPTAQFKNVRLTRQEVLVWLHDISAARTKIMGGEIVFNLSMDNHNNKSDHINNTKKIKRSRCDGLSPPAACHSVWLKGDACCHLKSSVLVQDVPLENVN